MTRRTGIAVAAGLALMGVAGPAAAGGVVPAEGTFAVTIDFGTLTLAPVGANCALEVEGIVDFAGTLEGIARARTRALLLAPCDQVAVTPPGTFKDVFSSAMEFTGTANGEPALGDITYRGITKVGGDIDATMQLSSGMTGVLKVQAIVAVGGTYTGFVKTE